METGGGGSGGMATEMAVGLAIAQQMMQQQGGGLFPGASAGAGADHVPDLPELMSPAEVARMLRVSEADVMSLIESGELRAKRIGSNYRIKRSALDAYLSD